MPRLSSLILTCCFLMLALASCGGDDVNNGPFTAAEYVERGNGMCSDWLESIVELEENLGDEPEQSEIIEFTQTVGQLGGTNLANLMALEAPAEYTTQRAVLEQAFTDMALMQQDFANGTNDGAGLNAASQEIDSALQAIWPSCER